MNYSFINMNTGLSPSSEELEFKLFVDNSYLICVTRSITVILWFEGVFLLNLYITRKTNFEPRPIISFNFLEVKIYIF